MGTFSVYDADFMTHQHIIPSLECAKIVTYLHNRRQVATLSPFIDLSRFSKVYIQKNYDDGRYPNEFFDERCIYGGRAFHPEHYVPLPDEVENIIPDMSCYQGYAKFYIRKQEKPAIFNTLLNRAHLRLSTDETNVVSMDYLTKMLKTNERNGIIFHDYNLNSVKNVEDILTEITHWRKYKDRVAMRYYSIGCKFPIQIYEPQDLFKWSKFELIRDCFVMQYNGILEDDVAVELAHAYQGKHISFYYNITYNIDNEKTLLDNFVKIYKHLLIFKRYQLKTELIYSDSVVFTQEFKDLITLINMWVKADYNELDAPAHNGLYAYCLIAKRWGYMAYDLKLHNISVQKARKSFNFAREHNYELFDLFYTADAMILKDNKLIDEWDYITLIGGTND